MLRANGVKYFKSDEVEIKLAAPSQVLAVSPISSEPRPMVVLEKDSKPLGDIPIKEMQIPHQLNEMLSVLKMSPEQLVDKIFPEGA